MSVLIHGMNMPYSCADCDFCSGLIMPDNIYTCERNAGEIAGTDITKYVEAEEPTFPEWCPIDTVVHCKDCKYCEHTLKRPNVWKPNETSEEHYNCMRTENGIHPIVFPDSFCSFGKRGDMRVTL